MSGAPQQPRPAPDIREPVRLLAAIRVLLMETYPQGVYMICTTRTGELDSAWVKGRPGRPHRPVKFPGSPGQASWLASRILAYARHPERNAALLRSDSAFPNSVELYLNEKDVP